MTLASDKSSALSPVNRTSGSLLGTRVVATSMSTLLVGARVAFCGGLWTQPASRIADKRPAPTR